jgi:hypothetical protein
VQEVFWDGRHRRGFGSRYKAGSSSFGGKIIVFLSQCAPACSRKYLLLLQGVGGGWRWSVVT